VAHDVKGSLWMLGSRLGVKMVYNPDRFSFSEIESDEI
jgi:hypothetical protein